MNKTDSTYLFNTTLGRFELTYQNICTGARHPGTDTLSLISLAGTLVLPRAISSLCGFWPVRFLVCADFSRKAQLVGYHIDIENTPLIGYLERVY